MAFLGWRWRWGAQGWGGGAPPRIASPPAAKAPRRGRAFLPRWHAPPQLGRSPRVQVRRGWKEPQLPPEGRRGGGFLWSLSPSTPPSSCCRRGGGARFPGGNSWGWDFKTLDTSAPPIVWGWDPPPEWDPEPRGSTYRKLMSALPPAGPPVRCTPSLLAPSPRICMQMATSLRVSIFCSLKIGLRLFKALQPALQDPEKPGFRLPVYLPQSSEGYVQIFPQSCYSGNKKCMLFGCRRLKVYLRRDSFFFFWARIGTTSIFFFVMQKFAVTRVQVI